MNAPRSRPTALIVEDDLVQRLLASEALLAAGFEVVLTDDGAAAIAAFVESQPDIVVLDVVMPVSDGFEVCRRLRTLPGGAAVPIVMMTGLDDGDSITAAYDAGATDFIPKPLNLFLLAHRLRYLLRAAAAFRESKETSARLVRTQRLARLAQWEVDLQTGTFRWARESGAVLSVPERALATVAGALLDWIHPGDRRRVADLFDPPRAHKVDYRVLSPDGTLRVIHQEAEVVIDENDGRTKLIGAAQDVSELREAERRVHNLANFDSVTGLPNRGTLREFLADAVADAERTAHLVSVMSVDLDLFKRVNDTLGHAAGDALLNDVGARLASAVRACPSARGEGFVARSSGDEFAVVLTQMKTAEAAADVARCIGAHFAESFKLAGQELYVSASIGIATYPDCAHDVDALLEQADAAMHQVKDNGRNGFQFFSTAMHERARRHLELENGLRAAVSKLGSLHAPCDFELHFQPKVEVPSMRVTGAEALLRWTSKDKGFVSPAEFIPIAEDTGLIVALGEWVLRKGCAVARQWQLEGTPLRTAVNVSARQFLAPGFSDTVRAALAESSLDPSLLELEITEGTVMGDSALGMRVLDELKKVGVSIALDDFGTGYSSLGYLTKLPIDVLKIDRAFVKSLGTNPKNETITEAILALSRGLGIHVVAEGVETEAQLAFFRAHAPVDIQGYLFAKPMPVAAFAEWLGAFARKHAPPRRSSLPATRQFVIRNV